MVKIYALYCNRSDFMEMQLESFRRYLQDDFEFVVLNNAPMSTGWDEHKAISDSCSRLGLSMIDIERTPELDGFCQQFETEPIFSNGRYANANVACAYSLNWAWKKIISKQNCGVCILHSDVFLLSEISFRKLMDTFPIAYISLSWFFKIDYIWEAFALLDIPRLPEPETINWWSGYVDGLPTDVGGQTALYLRNHQDIKKLPIVEKRIENQEERYSYFALENNVFALHYMSGSNWNNKSEQYHRAKTEWLKRQLV